MKQLGFAFVNTNVLCVDVYFMVINIIHLNKYVLYVIVLKHIHIINDKILGKEND